MNSVFNSLPHRGIQTLVPYEAGKSIESLKKELGLTNVIKLASNENPLGCSPLVTLALARMPPSQIAAYPSPLHHPLHTALTSKLRIDPKQLLLANGSDALFSLLMTTFALHTGKTMLTHDLAFNAFGIQAQTLGIPTQFAAIHADWQVNLENLISLCQPSTALVFLANPNNPTGKYIPLASIKTLLSHLAPTTLLVLDEAYIDYMVPEENTISWLRTYPNLVLLRTFSKVHGLAGLRIGYAIACPEIIQLLMRAQLPFTVNQAAMTAALAALEDKDFVQRTVALTREGMIQLSKGLSALSLKPISSTANFITVDCLQPAQAIYEALLQQGIIVRPLLPYGLPNHLRITIGTPEQITRLLESLSIILNKDNHDSPFSG